MNTDLTELRRRGSLKSPEQSGRTRTVQAGSAVHCDTFPMVDKELARSSVGRVITVTYVFAKYYPRKLQNFITRITKLAKLLTHCC